MKASRLDHVGIAVVSIDEALKIWNALGLRETRREEVPTQRVRTALLPVGDSSIELLEPTGEDSPVARFLAKRGPGIHHVCFRVADLEGAIAELSAGGFRLLTPAPTAGAGGKRIAFLHPEAGQGVLIELAEKAGEP